MGGLLPLRTQARQQRVILLQGFIAGFQYYNGLQLFNGMKPGASLQLIREPENLADKNAIALYYQEKKVGFVPAKMNKTICRLMDGELIDLFAEISYVEPKAADWEKVNFIVYSLRPEGKRPKHTRYTEQIKKPCYKTINRKQGGYNDRWHDILIEQSQTDHIYSLIYNNLYPDFGGINHRYDFVAINKDTIPFALRNGLDGHFSRYFPPASAEFDKRGMRVLNNHHLGKYLEAAKRMKEVYDISGRNYIELIF